jgi:hypothetical protein
VSHLPLLVGAPVVIGGSFLVLLILMIVLLIRAIRGLDDDELEGADGTGFVQRLFESFRGLR